MPSFSPDTHLAGRDSPPPVALIGAGPMAVAQAKALTALGIKPAVVGRGASSAKAFTHATDLAVFTGGLATYLAANPAPVTAVICVGVADLANTSTQLLHAGAKRLLVEKPGALDPNQLRELAAVAKACDSEVYVAYNRRFYPSTRFVADAIAADGGATSLNLVFTERARQIGALDKDPAITGRWVLANSTHVLDLGFFLAGTPKRFSAWRTGSLEWHASSRFAGAGVTTAGALFTYRADWDGPGGWGVEVITQERRLVMEPLETVRVQVHGATTAQAVAIPAEPDGLKPGLLGQLQAFLHGIDVKSLLTLDQHLHHTEEVTWPLAYGTDPAGAVSSLDLPQADRTTE